MAEPNKWVGVGIVALLTIGAGLGRASVEPIYVTETETIVETETVTEYETIDTPYIPEACLQAIKHATVYSEEAKKMTDSVTVLLDGIAQARKGMVSGDIRFTTQAENTLRRVDEQTLESYVNIDQIETAYQSAQADCQEQIK